MLSWIKLALITLSVIAVQPVLADSAAAWKDYQEGRNPLLEVGLLFVGTILFFSVLVFIHKVVESKKKNRRKKGRK